MIIRTFFLIPIAWMLAFTNASSASLVITSSAGTTHQADGYSTFGTTSADMVGMEVTVTFHNGSTDTQLWTASGISGNGWTMTQGPGSTFNFPFVLTNTNNRRLTSFVMRGAGSSTIFDRSVANSTAGTANGRDLQEFTNLSSSQDVFVNYFDQVQTTGSTPIGDIYAGMSVEFDRRDGISRRGGQFIFRTDTDTVINVVTAAVPEPTAAATFGLAIGGLMFRRRRK